MKIKFEDNSYIEAKKSLTGDIIISIAANDNKSIIVHSLHLTIEQFKELIKDIL